MLRLGHIEYSNCLPVHALLLEQPVAGIELVRDVPSRLNAALAAGRIDVAPCSSIEYARHAGDYTILPGLAIGSCGPVQSILLDSALPLDLLDRQVVAVPTASATSVVLLRVLLELRYGVKADLRWFEQGAGTPDPLDSGAAAVLRIGDVALTHSSRHDAVDLGAEWTAWTGLPFAFAVWQVRRDADADAVRRLTEILAESRAWFCAHAERLAQSYAPRYGLTAPRLLDYWSSLQYELSPAMQEGLLHFYQLAATVGEAPPVHTLSMFELPPA